MTPEQQEEVKQILRGLLEKMGIAAEIQTEGSDEETLIFNIRTPDSGILIGNHGIHLEALQYLARVLAHKQMSEPIHFVIDVEGYKQTRVDFLKELAKQAADRVRQTRETLYLRPMASYERRVIHAEISKYADVASESVGDEPDRKVVIKPKV